MTMNQERIDVLESILLELHHGATPESVQEEFNKHFTGVSAIEIAMMEQQLVYGDSEITFEDVLKLCNVHAKMFEGAIDEATGAEIDQPGHPVRVMKDENLAFRSALLRIDNILNQLVKMPSEEVEDGFIKGLTRQFELIGEFDIHYERKEKVFFPLMEKYGHMAPSKVMWAKDDEIRDLFKDAIKMLRTWPETTLIDVQESFAAFRYEFEEMIFKEEAILLNILLESLNVSDWLQAANESEAYGYAILPQPTKWEPKLTKEDTPAPVEAPIKSQENEEPKIQHMPVLEPTASSIPTTKLSFPQGNLTLLWQETQAATDEYLALDYQQSFQFGDGRINLHQIQQILAYLPLELRYYNRQLQLQYSNKIEDNDKIGESAKTILANKNWDKLQELFINLLDDEISEESKLIKEESGWIHYKYLAIKSEDQVLGVLELRHSIQEYLELPKKVNRDYSPIEAYEGLEKPTIELVKSKVFAPSISSQQIQLDGKTVTITVEDSGRVSPTGISDHQLIDLGRGALSKEEMKEILNNVPFELSFVDSSDTFLYFNNIKQYEEMIFKRTPVQVGRSLELCHPPFLWEKVDSLVTSFKTGERYYEALWYQTPQQFIHMFFQAHYNEAGDYIGMMEAVIDIQPYLNMVNQNS